MPRLAPTRAVTYIAAFVFAVGLLSLLRSSNGPATRTIAKDGGQGQGSGQGNTNSLAAPPSNWHLPSPPNLHWPTTSQSPPSFIPPKPAAGYVILCRNADLGELLPTLSALESTFNAHPYTAYPYIFLNDEQFTDRFKHKMETYLASVRQRYGGSHTPPPDIRWGVIAKDHWDPPDWIDMDKAHTRWARLKAANIPYAESLSYRNMCRWQSGFFYKHPLVRDLKYYWRVEPSTRFTCNIVPEQGRVPTSWDGNADGRGDFFDPFRWMNDKGKLYGWVLSLREYQHTIRSLWPWTRTWMLDHPEYHSPNLTLLDFVLKPDKIGYNLCHYWSNFEIASLDFFRSEAYQAYFDFIDSRGQFYYDRVGDAPFHTIAVAWLLGKDQVHQFENIGYYHAPFTACPRGPQYESKCACNQFQRFDYDLSNYTCQFEWDAVQGINSTAKILDINKQVGWPEISNFAVLEGYQHG